MAVRELFTARVEDSDVVEGGSFGGGHHDDGPAVGRFELQREPGGVELVA